MRYGIEVLDNGFHRLTVCKPLASDSGKYLIKASNDVKRVDMVHNVTFTGKDSHLHVYGIFHSQKPHERATIQKAHDETMAIIAEVTKKENKGGSKYRGGDATSQANVKNKLIWGTILRDRTSVSGTKVKLVCTVVGPDPQMRWFKNDNPVAFGPKIRNGTHENLGTIEIISVSTEDSGAYKCVAKNGTNEISTMCNLNVYSRSEPDSADLPPTFTVGLRGNFI